MVPIESSSTPHSLHLSFFDLDVRMRSDSSASIALFARMYSRFQVDETSPATSDTVEIVFLSGPDNPWGTPVLIVGDDVQLLRDPKLLDGYVYESILHTLMVRVRSHLLIHAGAVSHDGQGVVLVADAWHGKTTLVLELVRRRFQFLSDEIAALSRADSLVYPFPRSLRIRPGTLELVGYGPAAAGAPTWLGKLLLDIDQIEPHRMGVPVPVDHVVLLQDPAQRAVDGASDAERTLTITFDQVDDGLMRAIRQIPGVLQAHCEQRDSYPTVRVQGKSRYTMFTEIETLCHAREVLIIDVSHENQTRPDFDTPARLEPVSKTQVIRQMMRQFRGGFGSHLFQDELGGSSSRLFMEIAALLDNTVCHRLYVGRLDQMADLLCGVVDDAL